MNEWMSEWIYRVRVLTNNRRHTPISMIWERSIQKGACSCMRAVEKHKEWYRNPGRRREVATPLGYRRWGEIGYWNWEGTRFVPPTPALTVSYRIYWGTRGQRAQTPPSGCRELIWRYLPQAPGGLVLDMHRTELCEMRNITPILPRKQNEIS